MNLTEGKALWLKWWETIRITWTREMAYKLNFFLLIIGPTVVFFFIKYNLWSTIYSDDPSRVLSGFDFPTMIAYQSWVMIVSFLAQGYHSINLAEDIRLGRISAYLIYPFQFWQFHMASFIAFQGIQLLVAAFSFGCLVAGGLLPVPSAETLLAGILLCWLVGFVWFGIHYCIGLMAFWLDETWVLRVIMNTVAQFVSGALIPLEFFPGWFQEAAMFTPFPWMTWAPVQVFMGTYSGSILQAFAVLGLWLVAFLGAGRWIFSRGLRMYTAAGM